MKMICNKVKNCSNDGGCVHKRRHKKNDCCIGEICSRFPRDRKLRCVPIKEKIKFIEKPSDLKIGKWYPFTTQRQLKNGKLGKKFVEYTIRIGKRDYFSSRDQDHIIIMWPLMKKRR